MGVVCSKHIIFTHRKEMNKLFSYEFRLETGDRNKGTVYLPNEESLNLPVIIYCHGWAQNRRLWPPIKKLCDKAMAANIAFVTFDFYGCGETGGDYSLMTYSRWKNNLSDIVSWCGKQPFANADKIGSYAFSSGSTAALRLAAENECLKFLVSVGTCISSHVFMETGGPAKILADNLDELMSGGVKEISGISFGLDFYLDTVSKAPINFMGEINCPVLFLQGLADNPHRCADARMAYQLMKNQRLSTKLLEFPNGNHALENVIDKALDSMFDWLGTIV